MSNPKIEDIGYLLLLVLCVSVCSCKDANTTDKPSGNIIPHGIYIGMTRNDYLNQKGNQQDSITFSGYKFEIIPQFVADTLNSLSFYHEYEGTDTIYQWERREINCRDLYLDSAIQTTLTNRYGSPQQLRNELLWESGDTIIKMGYDEEDDFLVSKHFWYKVYTTYELMFICIKQKE